MASGMGSNHAVERVAKNAPLTAAFLARGYGESLVRKILGGNMLRLFETTWDQPRRAA